MKKSPILFFFVFMALPLFSLEVLVKTPGGEAISLSVDEDASVADLVEQVENYCADEEAVSDEALYLDFWADEREEERFLVKGDVKRTYKGDATKHERDTLRYIVLTLGNKEEWKLAFYQPELRRRGNSIDYLHPLDFWRIIFTDKETVAAMHNIQGRSLAWRSFISETGDKLNEEYIKNNLTHEQIADFSKKVNVKIGLIEPLLRSRQWEKFVRTLISNVPRGSNTSRYDM